MRMQSCAMRLDYALERGGVAAAGGVQVRRGTGFSNWMHSYDN
jgi:hypothetical protein